MLFLNQSPSEFPSIKEADLTPGGAHASATVYTMVEMAKAHGLNVEKYLMFLLEKRPHTGMPDEELEALGTGALRRAVQEGDNEKGCFLSGQVAAMVKKEQPAAEIVKEVMEEAEPLLLRASQWVR